MHKRSGLTTLELSAAVLGVAMTTVAPSQAQDTDDTRMVLEEIVVTGTLLRDRDASSANPVTVVSEEEIAQAGAVSVNDILARVPALGGQGLSDTTALGQQSGSTFIDLRNLGPTRTLVLLNGRRASQTFGSGPGSVAVDINSIPVSMIDHIDVLRDGASPIYGSDAIAGVVNVITKGSFDGLRVDVGGGASRYGDRLTGSASVLGGKEFDRGGFLLGLDFTDKGRAGYDERPFYSDRVTAVGFDANGDGIVTQYGQPNLNPGGVIMVGGVPTTTFTGPGVYRAYDPEIDAVSADLEQAAISASQRASVNVNAHFDFTDSVRSYTELSYTHNESEMKDLAVQNRSIVIPANHPNNPFGAPVTMVRAFPETRGAYVEPTQDIYRAVAGVEGDLGRFHWDINYVWGQTRAEHEAFDEIDVDSLTIALSPTRCATTPGCALVNPFGPGTISQEAVEFFTADTGAENRATLNMVTASLSGQLLDLPAGALSLAVGADYREDEGEYANEMTTREVVRYSGMIKASEVYGEVNVPLLRDVVIAQSLSINGAVRYSDYERFGSATTGKVGLNWALSDSVRLRANRGTGFRAPNLSEFFAPTAALGNQRGLLDPCSAPVAPENSAACASAGVPSGFIDTGGGKPIANGGNPDLSPEKADQLNIGIVLTPSFADLSVTADYYKVELEDAIVAPSAQFVLDQCYASGAALDSPYCANVSRDANGTITEIRSIVQNIGRVETDGVDFGVNYRFPLGAGRMSLNWNTSYLLSYRQQDIPGGEIIERAGSLRSSPAIGSYPELKSQLRTTYSGDQWSIGYALRMIGEAEVLGADPATNPYNEVSAVFYSDMFASASVKNVQLTAGVNNLFDKRAPLYFTTTGQRDFGLYDPLGRYFYLRASYSY